MLPMLATPTATPGLPPVGEGWLHEVKWDGVRAMGLMRDGVLQLTNRTGGDITAGYPEVVAGAAGLPDGVHLDGELIALDEQGLPSFAAIAHRMHLRESGRVARAVAAHPVTYVVFDLVAAAGHDLTRRPLAERRELLEGLDLARAAWQLSQTSADGAALAVATLEAGLEGVLSKRLDSTYQPGVRSPDWVKAPHRRELVAVIGGWVPETASDRQLGSVWVGHATDEASFDRSPVLYPLGRVGSGLSLAERADLLGVLRDIERPTCPIDPRPDGPEVRRTHWVEPMLCVQVRYLSVQPSGALRQPVLRCLRPDVSPVAAATADLLDA